MSPSPSLFQRLEVRYDVCDLLVGEAGVQRDLGLRVVLTLALSRHEAAGLHGRGVLDPRAEVLGVVRKEPAADREPAADVRQVGSNDADAHRRVALDGVA